MGAIGAQACAPAQLPVRLCTREEVRRSARWWALLCSGLSARVVSQEARGQAGLPLVPSRATEELLGGSAVPTCAICHLQGGSAWDPGAGGGGRCPQCEARDLAATSWSALPPSSPPLPVHPLGRVCLVLGALERTTAAATCRASGFSWFPPLPRTPRHTSEQVSSWLWAHSWEGWRTPGANAQAVPQAGRRSQGPHRAPRVLALPVAVAVTGRRRAAAWSKLLRCSGAEGPTPVPRAILTRLCPPTRIDRVCTEQCASAGCTSGLTPWLSAFPTPRPRRSAASSGSHSSPGAVVTGPGARVLARLCHRKLLAGTHLPSASP